MSTILIVKDNQGKLRGVSEEHERAYAKWRKLVNDMEPGEILEFDFTIPRSPKHHRLFMHKVRTLLKRTEAFTRFDDLRLWLVTGAGYVTMESGPDGTPNAVPQSLEYASLDEADFCELHNRVDDYLWTAHAQEFLWPHLDQEKRYFSVQQFLEAFKQRQEQQL